MRELKYTVPSEIKMDQYIVDAKKKNDGPWDKHSKYVGQAAMLIAQKCKHLDSTLAYSMGCLHDIGRREGRSYLHHTIEGYNFMMQEGYEDIGRICLTHSFPIKDIRSYFGKLDCSDDEIEFIREYLNNVVYNDYDKLIQLCDALALPTGFCLMEKRMIDVALRYGVNENTIEKWKITFEIKDYFENLIGCSIYDILPNVKENTFEFE